MVTPVYINGVGRQRSENALAIVFQQYAGHGKFGRMGNRQGSMGNAKASGNLCGASPKMQVGSSAGLPNDFDFEPAHAVANPRPKGLGSRFLGGKSGGKAFRRFPFAQAVFLFPAGIDAVKETSSITIHGLLDTPDLYQINSGADNHAGYKATTFCICCVCGSQDLVPFLGKSQAGEGW